MKLQTKSATKTVRSKKPAGKAAPLSRRAASARSRKVHVAAPSSAAEICRALGVTKPEMETVRKILEDIA